MSTRIARVGKRPVEAVPSATPPPERGSDIARRVTAAFRDAAASAVEVNLSRGHTVVGVENGRWVEKKRRD